MKAIRRRTVEAARSGSMRCTAYATTEAARSPALLAGGLVGLLNTRSARGGRRTCGGRTERDLLGVLGDDAGGGADDGGRLRRQQLVGEFVVVVKGELSGGRRQPGPPYSRLCGRPRGPCGAARRIAARRLDGRALDRAPGAPACPGRGEAPRNCQGRWALGGPSGGWQIGERNAAGHRRDGQRTETDARRCAIVAKILIPYATTEGQTARIADTAADVVHGHGHRRGRWTSNWDTVPDGRRGHRRRPIHMGDDKSRSTTQHGSRSRSISAVLREPRCPRHRGGGEPTSRSSSRRRVAAPPCRSLRRRPALHAVRVPQTASDEEDRPRQAGRPWDGHLPRLRVHRMGRGAAVRRGLPGRTAPRRRGGGRGRWHPLRCACSLRCRTKHTVQRPSSAAPRSAHGTCSAPPARDRRCSDRGSRGLTGWRIADNHTVAYSTEDTVVVSRTPTGTVQLDTRLYVPDGVSAQSPAPAVVLAHGFGGTKASVSGAAADLADRGFVVVAYTARGFGKSTGSIGLNALRGEVVDAHNLVTGSPGGRRSSRTARATPRGHRGGVLRWGAGADGRRHGPPRRRDRPADHVEPAVARLLPNGAGAPQQGGPASPAESDSSPGAFKREGRDLLRDRQGTRPRRCHRSRQPGRSAHQVDPSRGPEPDADTAGPRAPGAPAPSGSATGGEAWCAAGSHSTSAASTPRPQPAGRSTRPRRARLDASSPWSVAGAITAPTFLVRGGRHAVPPVRPM